MFADCGIPLKRGGLEMLQLPYQGQCRVITKKPTQFEEAMLECIVKGDDFLLYDNTDINDDKKFLQKLFLTSLFYSYSNIDSYSFFVKTKSIQRKFSLLTSESPSNKGILILWPKLIHTMTVLTVWTPRACPMFRKLVAQHCLIKGVLT